MRCTTSSSSTTTRSWAKALTTPIASIVSQPLFGFYRPVAFLFVHMETAAYSWGAPWAFATTSIVLHGVNAVLVGALTRQVSRDADAAWLATGVFFASPWSAEAFLWASGRFDLLAMPRRTRDARPRVLGPRARGTPGHRVAAHVRLHTGGIRLQGARGHAPGVDRGPGGARSSADLTGADGSSLSRRCLPPPSWRISWSDSPYCPDSEARTGDSATSSPRLTSHGLSSRTHARSCGGRCPHVIR
jgi:hypothetical protein